MVTAKELRFTRADYMQLPEGMRVELIDGHLVKEPAPTGWHQVLTGKIHLVLAALVGPYRVVLSPIDVFVDEENVLQPDLAVLPESAPVRPGDARIAIPALVIEVLSPATEHRDRRRKPPIYFGAGVREVWLVDPSRRIVEILTPLGTRRFEVSERPRSDAVPGFELDLAGLFAP